MAAALPRIEAPSTISAIIEQVMTDPMITSRVAVSVSAPWAKATSAAPSTPTAAASDGVAMPPYIEPSTHRIRKRAGARSFSAAKRSPQLISRRSCSAGGTRPGRSQECSIIQPMKLPASMKPGRKPAVKSCRIETSASTP